MNPSKSISTDETNFYSPVTNVIVDTNTVILNNQLSLGFMLSFEAKTWSESASLTQLASKVHFGIIRIVSYQVEPCVQWNEPTKTGAFDWTRVDQIIQKIFQVGAEPLIVLGYSNPSTGVIVPPSMAIDPNTGLPNPDSWAAYCTEWANHFQKVGLPVRFYEIINEPWSYFGWNNYTKIGCYMNVFNASTQAMRDQNANVLLGFDGSDRKPVLTYWLSNGGANLDFISFHKYDSDTIGKYSDATMLSKAETFLLQSDSSYYGVADAQQAYYTARHKIIPVINSESNFNSAWAKGADPEIQQMVGAVWTALVLRTGVLVGLTYNVYQCFGSSASWEKANKPSGGTGFGLVNLDNNQPWYPYIVNWMLGTSLGRGDPVFKSSSSSDSIRVLAWNHSEKICVILICMLNQTFSVLLNGLPTQMNLSKIDNSISSQNPRIQTSIVNLTQPLEVSGYTVLRLESP